MGKAPVMPRATRKATRTAADTSKDALKRARTFIDKVIVPRRRAAARPDPRIARAGAKLEREELELAKRELAAAGFDVKRLDKLAAERSKLRGKLADQAHKTAVAASAAAWNRLKGQLPPLLPAEPVDIVVDQVTYIQGYSMQGRRGAWNIGPGDNWAKYRLDSSVDSENYPGRISFFTLWRNRLDTPITLMAKAQLIVNAYLAVSATGNGMASWFGATSQATATVRARTTVWNMDVAVSSVVHEEVLASAAARANFWGDDSSRSIAFNQLMPATGVTIAPQAWSLIEVEVATEWQEVSGSVRLDAEGGSHRIDVPQLVLSQIIPPAPPPITLTAGVDTSTSPANVVLIWTGASGALVDIYRDGIKLGNTENDGTWIFPVASGTHSFRVCELGSSVCSAEATVTVP